MPARGHKDARDPQHFSTWRTGITSRIAHRIGRDGRRADGDGITTTGQAARAGSGRQANGSQSGPGRPPAHSGGFHPVRGEAIRGSSSAPGAQGYSRASQHRRPRAVAFHVAKNTPRSGLWLDQLSLGISRKRMSVLAIVP